MCKPRPCDRGLKPKFIDQAGLESTRSYLGLNLPVTAMIPYWLVNLRVAIPRKKHRRVSGSLEGAIKFRLGFDGGAERGKLHSRFEPAIVSSP